MMPSFKHVLVAILMAASLMIGFHIAHYFPHAHAMAQQSIPISPSGEALLLAERLIRFGQTAYDRGEFNEAKNFFQKAITIYPANLAAWKKYNMALLSLISAKVETDPDFLPSPSPNSPGKPAQGPQTIPQTEASEDGC